MKGNMFNVSNRKQRSGVRVGDYAPQEQINKPYVPQDHDQNPVIGYIEPAGETPQWIAWFTEQGDLYVYPHRDPSGAVSNDSITIKNSVGNPEFVALHGQRDLFVNGDATDNIWTMGDARGKLGIRFDCGDSGVIYVTRDQAEDLRVQLGKWLLTQPVKES